MDCYYRDLSHLAPEERARCNFDIPQALDEELLASHIQLLAQGVPIEKPVYDFARHVRTPRVEIIRPGRFVIVEGLFTLYWEAVRCLLALKIYVDTPDAVCLARRIERDVRERGRTPDSVRQQWQATVRPMAERYVLPTRRFADVVVSGTEPLAQLVATVLDRLASITGLSLPGGLQAAGEGG